MYLTCRGHILHCQLSTRLAFYLVGGRGGGLDTASDEVGGIVLVLPVRPRYRIGICIKQTTLCFMPIPIRCLRLDQAGVAHTVVGSTHAETADNNADVVMPIQLQLSGM